MRGSSLQENYKMTLEDIIIKCDYCKRKFPSIKAVREHSTKSHNGFYKVNATIAPKNFTLEDCIAMQELEKINDLQLSDDFMTLGCSDHLMRITK